MSMLNLSQKARQRPASWLMIALLPDIKVSNLKKSESNPKLALKGLKLYHKCSDFLNKSFKDPNQAHCIWVHRMGWTDVYFQLGLIIRDTEQHNRVCGFCRGNGLVHRHYICHNCSCLTMDSDLPNPKCTEDCVGTRNEFVGMILKPPVEVVTRKLGHHYPLLEASAALVRK